MVILFRFMQLCIKFSFQAFITDYKECFKYDHDSLGNDLSDRPIKGITNPKECQDLCKADPSCFYFSVNLRNDPIENNGCWLKKDVGSTPPRPRVGVTFGPKHCNGKQILILMCYFYYRRYFKSYKG